MLMAVFAGCLLRTNPLPDQNITNSQRHCKVYVGLQTCERVLKLAIGTKGFVIGLTDNIQSAQAHPLFGCKSDKRRTELGTSAALQVRSPRFYACESYISHEADDLLDRIIFEGN